MTIMVHVLPRRAALAGAGLGLLVAARRARALDAEAAAGLIFPDDKDAGKRSGWVATAPWGAGADRLWAAAAADQDHTMYVALVKEDADGANRSIVAGPIEVEALSIDPFWTLDLSIHKDTPLGPNVPAFNVQVSNSYLSTGRSTGTEAIHLFLYRNDVLRLVFSSYVQADHSSEVTCRRRRPDGDACRRAWNRAWTVAAATAAHGSDLPTLLVREKPSGRVVSRHIWRNDAYHPPSFETLPDLA